MAPASLYLLCISYFALLCSAALVLGAFSEALKDSEGDYCPLTYQRPNDNGICSFVLYSTAIALAYAVLFLLISILACIKRSTR
jgi:hypothetical protein